MSYSVDIKGLKEFEAQLKNLPAKLEKEANGILQRGAAVFVAGAKRDAPKDFAGGIGLAGGISFTPNPVRGLNVQVVSSVFYSPYVEWGTILHVSVPAELSAYAIQFKGKGIRKTGGLYPRPFFFKQLPAAKAAIEQGFKALLNDLKL